MTLSNLNKSFMKPILIITLLVVMAGAATGCEDFGLTPSPQPPEEKTEEKTPPTVVRTEDRAILAVYEHLLSQAESYQAKVYLADFYSASDNWNAKSELLKDGTSIWHIVVEMTGTEAGEERPYWQQASWLILPDGKVIPSNRFEANALRIEADLQQLSLQPGTTKPSEPEEE